MRNSGRSPRGIYHDDDKQTYDSHKSLGSEFNNGIDRTITVYDYNGNEIRHWEGKFDVTESETGILFDDQNGKRTIITGEIVINEENP